MTKQKVKLLEELDTRRREIRTDGYQMSIGEWISLYEKSELDIHPEFQRIYRWSDEQKSNLIESILLGIPVPPIFVSTRKDGVWDVIDGLQRLSTIFELLGILKNDEDVVRPALKLKSTKYLPQLEGMKWENPEHPEKELPAEAKLTIKRAKISASIVLKESDENAKYDLFQRLNTGGSQLSAQEVRNCLLVMLNKPMFDWLKQLVEFEPFKATTALSERLIDEAYDTELALRFVVLNLASNEDLQKVGDVGVFLAEHMTEMAKNKRYPYKRVEDTFKNTFQLLYDTAGEDAFKRYNGAKSRHEGPFLVSQFEAVALGLGFNVAQNTAPARRVVAKRISGLWERSEFTAYCTSGITAARRIPKIVPFGRAYFSQKR
ncbi:MAG TPA: DUF262 domain-containing protein [Burkholderiaceae bacterium]|nr:DUF262 domain-containing protein [Burkholderiaceae bacterium]